MRELIARCFSRLRRGRTPAAQLRRQGAPRWLVRAAKDASARHLDTEEQAFVARVEGLRQALEADQSKVEIADYGAGAADQPRSETEMERGVTTQRRVAEMCRTSSKPPLWCRLLFQIVRQQRPERCIEMGTCLGISGAYIGAALKLNGSGRLVTLEGAPRLAALARSTFEKAGLETVEIRVGRFTDTLPLALEALRPVEFVFVDGHHDGPATLAYFDLIRENLATQNVLVFDDIGWSDEMQLAWHGIRAQSRCYQVGQVGVCLDVAPAGPPI